MIGWQIDNQIIANSKGDCWTTLPGQNGKQQVGAGLSWLDIFLGDDRKDINVMYNLDAGVASLLKHLNITGTEAEKLAENERLYLAPYTIRYFPGRLLSIDYGGGAGHAFVNICNAKQYEGGRLSGIPGEAVDQANAAAETGDRIVQAFEKLGLPSTNLISPITAYLAANPLDIPTVDDIPPGAHEYAYNCVKGNWLEAFACGHWDEAYDYDINAAYPSQLARLVDLRTGSWYYARNNIPTDAMYGFMKGDLTTWAKFHPFIVRGEDDASHTPNGTWPEYITLAGYRLMEKYRVGGFDMKDGWFWKPSDRGIGFDRRRYPYANEILRLYEHRKNSHETITREVLHRIMSGLWGLTLQLKKGELGKYFNPVYGAVVEDNIRMIVAETCISHKIMPLHVAVDGIITARPITRIQLDDRMGGWRLSHKGKCIIASSSAVGFEGKDGKEEFSLTYEWLKKSIDARPLAKQYEKRKYSAVTLEQALKQRRLQDIGKIEEVKRTVYINPDYKRVWKERPLTGAGLLSAHYESDPLDINMLKPAGVE